MEPVNSLPSAADYQIKVTELATNSTALSQATFTITGAPLSLIASYSGAQIFLSWSSPGTAGHYRVLRRNAVSGGLVEIQTSTNNTSYIDNNLQQNGAYIYAVQRYDSYGALSSNSNLDAAVAMNFTDDPLIAGAMIKLAHVAELRAAINALRTTAGLGAFAFTDDPPATVSALHVNELRAALAQARSNGGLSAITYTDSVVASGVVKATDLSEIRGGVQ